MVTSRRDVLVATSGLFGGVLSGCTGLPSNEGSEPTPESTRHSTATPLPTKMHTLPDGPKSPPDPPETWSAETAREYAITYEKRHIYNMLFDSSVDEIEVSCDATEVEDTKAGYRVVLLCQGAAYYGEEGQHGDYIGRPVTYLVGEGSTIRKEQSAVSTSTNER